MTTFRAALFDMDGLLLDSERPVRDAWLQACQELNMPLDKDGYRCVIGRNVRDSKVILRRLLGPTFDYEGVAMRVASLVRERFADAGYALKPGVKEILAWLQSRRILLAVASSSDHHEVRGRLHKAGIDGFFGAFAGGDEVAHGKPAPDLYRLASKRLGALQPSDCVVFEDSEPGAEAALNAGMRVIIVPDLRPPSTAIVAQSAATLVSLHEALTICAGWLGDA